MNVKAQAVAAVVKKLEADNRDLSYKLERNKRDFARLTQEQTVMKRQKVVIQDLIWGLTGKASKVKT